MTVVDGAQDPELEQRLAVVRAGISEAARAAGRDESHITTIVVTKFHPASLIRDLHGLGVRDVGENRHQDAAPKAAELAGLDIRWHFVGQLQSKKARAVLDYARVIHSLDRDSLITALDAAGIDVTVFIQLNLTDDPGRGGVGEAALLPFAERVLAAPRLRLAGLMAVAPRDGDPRRAFARVRAAAERVRTIEPRATSLSMGMSADFRDAIAEGATHLRIGAAITGKRRERA